MKFRLIFALSSLAFSMHASAEGGSCPDGYYPIGGQGATGCAHFPENNERANGSSAPSAKWVTTWGAIVADGSNASIGSVVGMPTKRKAEKATLDECKADGGKNCRVDLAYHNQCAVLVSGANRYLVQSAETIDAASKVGIQKCGAMDTGCRVHYSGCTRPIRIK